MSVRSGQSITVLFTTRAFATGAATDATGTPTGALYLNGALNGASVTVADITGTGKYTAAVTLPTLAVNDLVEIEITATVSGVTDSAVVWRDTKDVFAGAIPDVAAGGTNGLFIAGTNAATTVTTSFTTTFTGNLSGSVGSVTGLTASDVGEIKTKTDFLPSATAGAAGGLMIAGSNAATTFATLTVSGATTLTGALSLGLTTLAGLSTGSVVLDELIITNWINVGGSVAVQNDLSITGTTTLILAAATKDAIASAIWRDTNTADFTTASSIGRSLMNAFTVAGGSVFTTAALANGPGGSAPTAAENADAVCDELLSGHVTAGSLAQVLAAIKTKADFLPAITAGSAGGLLIAGSNAATTFATCTITGAFTVGSMTIAGSAISSGTITLVAPVDADGTTVSLFRGDGYANADSRALVWTVTGFPSLTGATVKLKTPTLTGASAITGTVTSSTSVYFELTSAQTAAMNDEAYEIKATLTSGRVVTIATGNILMTGQI